jgi:DUF4097 and DUF4098 domain-containing protein YvlB
MRVTAPRRFLTMAMAVICVTACDAAFAQKLSENVDKTVAFPANGTLKLRNFSGAVHITGTSGNEVVIKAVRSADRDQMEHIKLDIQTSGSTVTIEANKRDSNWTDHENNVVETSFEIQVPASAALDVYGFSSDLDIKGVNGSEKLETFSGTIRVSGVKGALTAKTFNGPVDIDASAAGATPMLNVETFGASITARIAESTKAAVSFGSFSGTFNSQVPLTMYSSSRGKVGGNMSGGNTPGGDSGGSQLRFHTFSGDVKITK